MCTFATNLNEMMIIAIGEHLFPFRTEKLKKKESYDAEEILIVVD